MAEPLSSLIRPDAGPSLPFLARLAPPPAPNLLAAELEGWSSPGDVVIDLFGRGGWVARASVARLRRTLDFESMALTRLVAEVVLRPPDLRHFDAAVGSLGAQPRGESGLRQALNASFASRCPTCGRPIVVDEFVWDGDAPAPFRKTYRCTACRDQLGGGEQRSAPTDDADIALASALVGSAEAARAREALRERFPQPEGATDLADRILDLYTARSLVALQAILERIELDLRAAPIEAGLRLGLAHALLPASRLHSYPGRVGALRIVNGTVRLPGDRQWRERNPWLLFEDGCRLVRGFIQRLEASPGGPLQARLGDDLQALVEGAANVALRRGSAALPGQVTVADRTAPGRNRVRLVLSQPPVRWSTETLSFAYLATSIVLGREASSQLPSEPLFASLPRAEWGWEATALRRGMAAVVPLLAPDARAILLLEAGPAEGLVAGVLGGVGAGYALTAALLAESEDGYTGVLEFAPPGASLARGPRTRANVPLAPLPEAPDAGGTFRLADVEAATAEVAVEVLKARGEPARFERLLGEVMVGLDRRGHLKRLVGTRTFGETEARSARAAEALGLFGEAGPSLAEAPHEAADLPDPAVARPRRAAGDSPVPPRGSDQVGLLLDLIMGELRRPQHPRLEELEPGRWWLRDPRDIAEAAVPLADRLEWAVFSLLSTSGQIGEAAFFDRIASMFRGHDAPDEALVRACLDSYRSPTSTAEALRPADDLHVRSQEHNEAIGLITDLGHRLGMRCWIGAAEQRHLYEGVPLGQLLTEAERRAYLPLISRGAQEALEAIDAIWYVRQKATFLFEVEWTAMLTEPVLRRGPRIPTDDTVVRFLVVAPERTELLRYKLAHSPLLRRTMEADNWHILKTDHLRTLVEGEADLDRLGPLLGLDPEIESGGEQLSLFAG
ncbi:MAG TPA: hypothetical protein VN771_05250 [Candidatus Baltobacteraceae bacterium]|nr:hypothetical protein [Candidatus Baltobacteraceae bacterium]